MTETTWKRGKSHWSTDSPTNYCWMLRALPDLYALICRMVFAARFRREIHETPPVDVAATWSQQKTHHVKKRSLRSETGSEAHCERPAFRLWKESSANAAQICSSFTLSWSSWRPLKTNSPAESSRDITAISMLWSLRIDGYLMVD